MRARRGNLTSGSLASAAFYAVEPPLESRQRRVEGIIELLSGRRASSGIRGQVISSARSSRSGARAKSPMPLIMMGRLARNTISLSSV
jgi:hypothetical protein